jgi:hypothetical protein
VKKFTFFTLTLACFFSLRAMATITFNNALTTGASNAVLPPTTTTAIPGASPGSSPVPTNAPTTATFYFSNIAANTGNSNPSGIPVYSGDGTTPCNVNLNPACHNLSDSFTLNVSTSAALSGSPQMYLLYCPTLPTAGTAIASSGCTILVQVPFTNGAAVPNLVITWGSLCAKIAASTTPITDMSADCVSATFVPDNVPLYLMADVNGSYAISSEYLSFALWVDSVIPINSSSVAATPLGLYDFLAFPGDQQIIIQNPLVDAAFPTGENGVGAEYAKFYYLADTSGNNTFNANDFGNIPAISGIPAAGNGTIQTAQFLVNQTGGVLASGTISGLTDGVRYYLQATLVDFAGNIGYQTPTFALSPTDNTISHSAVPDNIVGLLSKSGQCFIATAAFGSPMADEVQILRDFRDRFLMPYHMGRKFISWYYRNGPEWASVIATDDGLRKFVRTFLYPLIGFSWLALHWGAYNAFLFTITLLMLPLLLVTWRRSRHLQMKDGE